MAVRIQQAASHRLDDIYRHTRDLWGEVQADRYITGLFKAFAEIETRGREIAPLKAWTPADPQAQ